MQSYWDLFCSLRIYHFDKNKTKMWGSMINGKLCLSHLFWVSISAVVIPSVWSLDTKQCVFESPYSSPPQCQLHNLWDPGQDEDVESLLQRVEKSFLLSVAVSLKLLFFFTCQLMLHFLRHEATHRVNAGLCRPPGPWPMVSTWACHVPDPNSSCAHAQAPIGAGLRKQVTENFSWSYG